MIYGLTSYTKNQNNSEIKPELFIPINVIKHVKSRTHLRLIERTFEEKINQ